MRQADAARVVLVRAVEETLPDQIAPETLLEAHAAAGDLADEPGWITRRAGYLVDHVLGAYRDIPARSALALPGPGLSIGLAVLLGLASNYLGPRARIHVVLNPIVLLIAWNLFVYALLAVHRARASRPAAPALARSAPAAPEPAGTRPRPDYRPGLLERAILGRSLGWILRSRERARDGVADAGKVARVARRFTSAWWPVVRPAFGLWLQRLLHLCAIGVALGAVAGMYVRGLFFAYRVVWRSTFVNDPGVVAFALRVLLGPAALVLGRPLPRVEDVLPLLTRDGAAAAPWIHLFAASALLFIVVPRALLGFAASRRLRRAVADVRVDLDEPYYRDLLQRARAVSPAQLEATVRDAVAKECSQFAGRLADFIGTALYDARLAPCLWKFRDEGGTLEALEERLRGECDAFGPALERELEAAQGDLERALVMRVRRLLGGERALATRPAADFTAEVGAASSRTAAELEARVGGDVGAMVAGVVSTAVALVVGTVSGGFGHSLGVALLAGLVHSGPVGWVIGALGGLVTTGAAFYLGREQLRLGIKTVPLPATALKLLFWRGRYQRLIAAGREQCDASIRESLAAQMAPLSAAIADEVWAGLRPVVGELQRPRPCVPQEL